MVEKLGLYAPAIGPLFTALAMGLGLEGRHGPAWAIRVVLLVVCLVLAALMFRKIRRENQPTAD